MSQQPQPYVVNQQYPRPESNGMGVAGLILSILGLITCGLLAPLGVLFSFFGLFKRPRGLAIAGFVVGLVGCCGGIIGLLVGAVGSVAALAGAGVAGQYAMAARGMDRLGAMVESSIVTTGSVPDDLASVPGVRDRALQDPWGHPYKLIKQENNKFDIISSGADGVAGTFDDLSLREIEDGPEPGHHRRIKRSIHID